LLGGHADQQPHLHQQQHVVLVHPLNVVLVHRQVVVLVHLQGHLPQTPLYLLLHGSLLGAVHDHLELPVVVALLPHDHQVLPDHHLLPLLPVPVQGVVGNLGQRVRLSRHLHRYLLKLVRRQSASRHQLREVVQEEIHLLLQFAGEVLMCHSVQDLRQEHQEMVTLLTVLRFVLM